MWAIRLPDPTPLAANALTPRELESWEQESLKAWELESLKAWELDSMRAESRIAWELILVKLDQSWVWWSGWGGQYPGFLVWTEHMISVWTSGLDPFPGVIKENDTTNGFKIKCVSQSCHDLYYQVTEWPAKQIQWYFTTSNQISFSDPQMPSGFSGVILLGNNCCSSTRKIDLQWQGICRSSLLYLIWTRRFNYIYQIQSKFHYNFFFFENMVSLTIEPMPVHCSVFTTCCHILFYFTIAAHLWSEGCDELDVWGILKDMWSSWDQRW